MANIFRTEWSSKDIVLCCTNSSNLIKMFCCLVAKLYSTLCDPMGYIACQAPRSTGFPRQEYCSRLPFPSPRESSLTRDWSCIFCIGRQILYHWATKEAQNDGLSFKLRTELIPQLTRVGCMEKKGSSKGLCTRQIPLFFSWWAKISTTGSWVGLVLFLQAKRWRC